MSLTLKFKDWKEKLSYKYIRTNSSVNPPLNKIVLDYVIKLDLIDKLI